MNLEGAKTCSNINNKTRVPYLPTGNATSAGTNYAGLPTAQQRDVKKQQEVGRRSRGTGWREKE